MLPQRLEAVWTAKSNTLAAKESASRTVGCSTVILLSVAPAKVQSKPRSSRLSRLLKRLKLALTVTRKLPLAASA
eukprot:8825330-Lingulodinium_polyedra.AAC.1